VFDCDQALGTPLMMKIHQRTPTGQPHNAVLEQENISINYKLL
jgi:hypothetical protein